MTNEELKRLYEQSKVVALASLEAEIKKVAEGPSVKWISDLEEYIEVVFRNQQVFFLLSKIASL